MTEQKPTAVWVFDSNRRVYRRDEDGRPYGGPIWREHWRRHEIVGETTRSWITKHGTKIPKKGGYGIAFTEEEIDRAAYIQDNRHRIADRVLRLDDHDTLKRIAELVGYEAPGELQHKER